MLACYHCLGGDLASVLNSHISKTILEVAWKDDSVSSAWIGRYFHFFSEDINEIDNYEHYAFQRHLPTQ